MPPILPAHSRKAGDTNFGALQVGHDFRMTDRAETLGLGLGDNCGFGQQPNTIAHDLTVTGSSALVGFFGPAALEVGGHDLVFTHNSAAPGGYLEVADNTVGHEAICESNTSPTGDAGDGPKVVGYTNTCG
jgi:hypothetical protein